MSDTLPWQGKRQYERLDWYMIHISDEDLARVAQEKSYYYMELHECIHGAFCENRWLFQRFLEFYEPVLSGLHYDVTETKNMTFAEYDDYIHNINHTRINPSWYIFRWEIRWLNISLYLNNRMLDGLYDAVSEVDPMVEIFSDNFFGCWVLLYEFSQCFNGNNSDLQIIKELLYKICGVYLPIYTFIVEGDYDGDWVDAIPQKVLDTFSSIVQFNIPIRNLEYTDIQESGYLFYFYLVRCCSYPGLLAGINENEPGNQT